MSRYIMTQQQLDRLQDKVQQLARLNEAKQERIKEMETRKGRVSNADSEDSKKAAKMLKDEINVLKKGNERLSVDSGASETAGVRQLKIMLEEERKLREYSEAFAKQAGLKWAEESILRELTSELCELQKAEIEIDNKRIQELQEKLEKLTNEGNHFQRNVQEKENVTEEREQVNFITEHLRRQLRDLRNEIKLNPVNRKEDGQQIQEIEKWMKELDLLVKEINDVYSLRKDLTNLRSEIENRRKSLSKH